MESKKDRRIVSKGEYVGSQAKRWSMRFTGYCLNIIAAAMCILMLSVFIKLGSCFAAYVLSGVFGILFYFAGKWGVINLQTAARITPGVPLTRHNVADLPAPDSLVRASAEPVQTQQAVLLRAAAEGQETPPEQLVRPTERPE